MPVQFLSDSDHARLNCFPQEITQADLDCFFWLSPDDYRAILGRRGDHNRLGVDLFLCCLRYLGFFPEQLSQLPRSVVRLQVRAAGQRRKNSRYLGEELFEPRSIRVHLRGYERLPAKLTEQLQ
ncbi:DUF4158 domain-containing protein [Leptolyngbya sp. FACHB-261]|uniref:DUF4158 domain-containing protein n=1 Tax=Leptolyngbya sp. FACHB-261 TaxID=2692806 RepID=UPI0016899F67|nr:DUF4158 domain-containing protein [Leptolyngbya sp. FACHB-261]MBD2100089.1 DUF4158 domain-containing protein [Leptolyngbya sp. FACHB-261]